MKMKRTKLLLGIICPAICLAQTRAYASASDGEKYITISIDASDDNGSLKYAIDSDEPSAFTDSNEFRILEGTSHTIYVKDVAGNITSQTYSPASQSMDHTYPEMGDPDATQISAPGEGGSDPRINIEVEIGDKQENTNRENDYSNYEYLTDDPIEPGGATVAEKVKTDGSDASEKVFYTFQTKEGETLYLVIDQGRDDNNVYLLDTVSLNDLMVLADGSEPQQAEKEDNLLAALSQAGTETKEEGSGREDSQSNSSLFIVLFAIAIAGGAYYYLKVYKAKKDKSMDEIDDAMDMDEFEAEDEDDIAEFEEINDLEKEAFLDQLINGEDDESFYDADPDEYAASGNGDISASIPEPIDDGIFEEGLGSEISSVLDSLMSDNWEEGET